MVIMIVKIKTMEKFETIVTVFVLVLSTVAVLLDATSTASSKEKSVTTRPYYNSDPFVRDLPPPSKDEPIGPRDDQEKNNSIRLLDNLNKNASFWRKAASLAVPTSVSDNTTAEKSSVTTTEMTANSSTAPVTSGQSSNNSSTLAPIDVNVTMTTDTVNTSFRDNRSTVVPSNGTKIPNETSEMVSSPSSLMTTSSPSLLSTISSPPTKLPKMPLITSSSIPMSKSPVINGTVHPKHRKSRRHPIVFFLLPILVAGGIAFIIFLGSYLRKKIRLDKLRHQLMPLYSFDPQEGEDWETELLSEPRPGAHPPTITTTRTLAPSTDPPKLRFAPDTVEV